MDSLPILHATEFDWDEHNLDKNRDKHAVNPGECEEVFFNQPLLVVDDPGHSLVEVRFHALGKSDAGRRLLVVFTLRGTKIRVISVRDMSRKERAIYEKHEV
jgi:uncharacterized protein